MTHFSTEIKKIITLVVVILSLLQFTRCLSQALPDFKVFTTESGLSSNSVSQVVQDKSGYLWVATDNGLNRFDGYSFKVFKYNSRDKNSPSGNNATCLAVDGLNRIWVGYGFSGITCYDPAINRFTQYKLDSTATWVTSIWVDKYNKIWAGVAGIGLVVLNPQTGNIEKKIDLTPSISKAYNPRDIYNYNVIRGMSEDSSGVIWLATADGLYRYDRQNDEMRPMRLVKDGPKRKRDDFFMAILPDDNGGFWLSSLGGGVCHYSPATGEFVSYKYPTSGLGQNWVYDVEKKSEHELWVTTDDKGLGIFDTNKKAFNFLTLRDIFGIEIDQTKFSFSYMVKDRNNVIWAGSNRALVRINPKKSWTFHPVFTAGVDIDVVKVVEDTLHQKIFMATLYGRGLIVSEANKKLRSYPGRKNPFYDPAEIVQDLLDESRDSLWVISRDNIRLFDKKRERWIENSQLRKLENDMYPASPSFFRMIKASTGNYWIATFRSGAYYLNKKDLSFKHFRPDPNANSIASDFLTSVIEDKYGRIWFSSNSGISIHDPKTGTFRRLCVEKTEDSFFLPSNQVSEMAVDRDGNVWAASIQIGVIKINIVNRDSIYCQTFDRDDVLTSSVEEVKIDKANRIWIRTPSAAHVVDPKTMHIQSFERQDGLLDGTYFILKSAKRMFVNGTVGFGEIDEADLIPDTTSLPLAINSVKVFGEDIFPSGAKRNQVDLPYDKNALSIDFSSINLTGNKYVKYSYKLEGVNNAQWSAPSSNRSTEFAGLDGGDYIFKLKASNNDGIWTKESNLLYIHIGTPFWKQYWFYILVALLAAAVIFIVYSSQIKRIRRQANERNEIHRRISQLQLQALHAQMNPHFIFNSLNAINGYIIDSETSKASEFLTQFSKLMRSILENSADQWILLDKEIETLRLYLNMECLRFEGKISYAIQVGDDIQTNALLIPSMILQPYVENAIWHGLLHKEDGTGRVTITFRSENGFLNCTIEDNGVGRARSTEIKNQSTISRKSFGMHITSERLKLLQDSYAVDVVDLKDPLGNACGTRIVLHLITKPIERNVALHNN